MSSWVTVDELQAEATSPWPQAAAIPPDVLQLVLDAAEASVIAYAPPLPVTDPVTPPPAHYRLAVMYQTREVWTASKRDGDLIAGAGGEYAVRARPLTAAVKSLVRPRRRAVAR